MDNSEENKGQEAEDKDGGEVEEKEEGEEKGDKEKSEKEEKKEDTEPTAGNEDLRNEVVMELCALVSETAYSLNGGNEQLHTCICFSH